MSTAAQRSGDISNCNINKFSTIIAEWVYSIKNEWESVYGYVTTYNHKYLNLHNEFINSDDKFSKENLSKKLEDLRISLIYYIAANYDIFCIGSKGKLANNIEKEILWESYITNDFIINDLPILIQNIKIKIDSMN